MNGDHFGNIVFCIVHETFQERKGKSCSIFCSKKKFCSKKFCSTLFLCKCTKYTRLLGSFTYFWEADDSICHHLMSKTPEILRSHLWFSWYSSWVYPAFFFSLQRHLLFHIFNSAFLCFWHCCVFLDGLSTFSLYFPFSTFSELYQHYSDNLWDSHRKR